MVKIIFLYKQKTKVNQSKKKNKKFNLNKLTFCKKLNDYFNIKVGTI